MENIQTLDNLDILFADFIQSILGVSADKVRIAYSVVGQKAPKMNETVVYIHVEQAQDDVQTFKNRETTKSNTGQFISSQSSMRKLILSCSIYGVDCDVIATRIKERMYFESSKQFFEQNNLALISSEIVINNKVHELINERWWERVDMNIGFYNSVTIEEYIAPIESVEVNISSENVNVVIGG